MVSRARESILNDVLVGGAAAEAPPSRGCMQPFERALREVLGAGRRNPFARLVAGVRPHALERRELAEQALDEIRLVGSRVLDDAAVQLLQVAGRDRQADLLLVHAVLMPRFPGR
jgi:hypothetical protein